MPNMCKKCHAVYPGMKADICDDCKPTASPKYSPKWANSGITAVFQRATGTIRISCYDSVLGVEYEVMPLAEFFRRTNIAEADCAKAFNPTKGATTA